MNCPVCENTMREHISHYKCSKCETVMNKTASNPRNVNLHKQIPDSQVEEILTFLKQVWKFIFFKIGGII